MNRPLIVDHKIALEKAARYCAYQERCQWDLEKKLKEWNIDTELHDDIMVEMIQQNFINEERFASSFVSGKINIKKWGRKKIRLELQHRQISNYSINKALDSIDEEKYIVNLQQWIKKKEESTIAKNSFEKRAKIFQYLLSKGFESNLINEELDNYGITR